MDKDEAWKAIKAVEDGDLPSGSVIVPITGPNSLLTPGGEPAIPGVPVKYTVVSDEHSDHNLPIGATVEPCEPPDWYEGEATWFTMGGDGDEVSIDPRDLAEIRGEPVSDASDTESDGTYPARFNNVIEVVGDIDPGSKSEELACEWGNPQACADDNELRARWAGMAVKTYANITGHDEPPETVIHDLLNDLRHLCDALGINFEDLVERDNNYQAELRGTF